MHHDRLLVHLLVINVKPCHYGNVRLVMSSLIVITRGGAAIHSPLPHEARTALYLHCSGKARELAANDSMVSYGGGKLYVYCVVCAKQ